MAVNPNDNRFFITLCNYLKKNSIEFEVIETSDVEFEGEYYSCRTEQLGVVEHTKENLMTAFDQILQMFSVPFYKLFLYKFFFDVIDSETNLGQYSLTYILIQEKVQTEELTETLSEEEQAFMGDMIEPVQDEDEPIDTNIENDLTEENLQDVSEESNNYEAYIEPEPEPEISKPHLQDERETRNQPDHSVKTNENSSEKRNMQIHSTVSSDQLDQNFFFSLQMDIDYLIKLLDKKINPEVSEVLSKAILIVIKNRLNID